MNFSSSSPGRINYAVDHCKQIYRTLNNLLKHSSLYSLHSQPPAVKLIPCPATRLAHLMGIVPLQALIMLVAEVQGILESSSLNLKVRHHFQIRSLQ